MKNYRIIIRETLGGMGKYKMPESTLRAHLLAALDVSELNEPQFQKDLKWLLDKALVDYKVEAESEAKLWFLTEEGKAK